MRRLLGRHIRELVLLAVLVAMMGFMATRSEHFLEWDNLAELSRHLAEVGTVACGMTLIIMTGGIDLSVGSLVGLAGIAMGYAWKLWGTGAAFGTVLAVGVLGGAINGLLVTRVSLPPLVVTLATMALFRGGAMIISRAEPVSDFPAFFEWFGQGDVWGVPTQLLVWLAVAVAAALVVVRTPVGRYAAAIGDNERAARFAGLPVQGVKLCLYTGTGLLCALAAVIWTSRFATAKADAGAGMELQVITAVVIGGTPITGGRGTVLGSFLAVVLLGVARNGLNLAGVPSVVQEIILGAILVATAIANRLVAGHLLRC
jgi:rhamnose transport system permease protein